MKAKDFEEKLEQSAEPIRQALKQKCYNLQEALLEFSAGMSPLTVGLLPEQREMVTNIGENILKLFNLIGDLDEEI